jgi:hypothetical protein
MLSYIRTWPAFDDPEDNVTSVYAIFNESAPTGTDLVLTEVVQPLRWSYDDALQDLRDIAAEAGVTLDSESTSVYVPVKGTHLETDEYYIVELVVDGIR